MSTVRERARRAATLWSGSKEDERQRALGIRIGEEIERALTFAWVREGQAYLEGYAAAAHAEPIAVLEGLVPKIVEQISSQACWPDAVFNAIEAEIARLKKERDGG